MWGSYPFCSAGLPHQKSFFADLNSLFYSLHQDSTLNAFHGGQALATALKLNNTVVDISLARNSGCGNEGAEACDLRWVDCGLGPERHWPTLTVSDFFELGVDGCCFCYSHVKLGCFHFGWMTAFFFPGNGGRSQHERIHPALELG